MAVIWFYNSVLGQPISGLEWAGLAALFFLTATFFAWRGEHRERENANKQLTNCEPDLRINVTEFQSGILENGERFLFLILEVTNCGADSIAKGWPMKMKTENVERSMAPADVPMGFTGTFQNGVSRRYERTDVLSENSATIIAKGGVLAGVLTYMLPEDISDREIEKGDVELTIECSDFKNKKSSYTNLVKQIKEDSRKENFHSHKVGQTLIKQLSSTSDTVALSSNAFDKCPLIVEIVNNDVGTGVCPIMANIINTDLDRDIAILSIRLITIRDGREKISERKDYAPLLTLGSTKSDTKLPAGERLEILFQSSEMKIGMDSDFYLVEVETMDKRIARSETIPVSVKLTPPAQPTLPTAVSSNEPIS